MPNPDCPPPASAKQPNTLTYSLTSPTIPPVVPEAEEVLPLAGLIDIGLQNSPATRIAWYQAKQAATDVGTARGAYLPSVNLHCYWLKEQFPEVDLGIEFLNRHKYIAASVSTSYLLFDFGGRNGTLMSTLSALDALDWYYNWEVQTVMMNVIQSYYDYINAESIVIADKATVEDNLTTLQAAIARRETGATSLSDQLQAETSLVQSQIVLEQDIAIMHIAMATLVRAMGLPADTPIDVSELPENIESEGVCTDIANIMQIAKENRADLWAFRSRVLEKRFEIRTAKSALLPTLTTDLAGSKQSLNGQRYIDAYSMQFSVNVPLFSSFKDINELRKTQAALLEAQANLDRVELTAFLEVVSDYYELLAGEKILSHSYSYVNIATENRKVAFAKYVAGTTTIIDLMVANNALNLARKQLANAKTNFLSSLANIAYDTGNLKVGDLCLGNEYPPWTEEVNEEE